MTLLHFLHTSKHIRAYFKNFIGLQKKQHVARGKSYERKSEEIFIGEE